MAYLKQLSFLCYYRTPVRFCADPPGAWAERRSIIQNADGLSGTGQGRRPLHAYIGWQPVQID